MWLPYFAADLGFDVTGIDYSPTGCEQARLLLSGAGVAGAVVCCDFFSPPDQLLGRFDVVFSYGVVEHFDRTADCIRSFARFLARGGTLLTIIPNMMGIPGFLQRKLNRDVYDKHVPLAPSDLDDAYRAAGLRDRKSGYLVSVNPGVINLEGLPRDARWLAKKSLMAALLRLSLAGWYFEEHVAALPTLRAFAAYAYCVGHSTGEHGQRV